ncbi:glycosyltransferase [Algoriphagus sp. NG3]|uniref:glycosyltransferase n=1 Tax=Algoriphagus sp. NG3 TaxID=3097546 RepID=UPI002A7F3BC5|nr:glycosyltransferase [Algoriphagus sp. NG3]WPR77405.1 TcdA/TcdB catalytic glycosyltransferase domain-containing protein [Algoriphagus sp. NG3]
MIPKRIHYCWFGQNSMTDLELNCIRSWKEVLPDYEINLWNEHNFDYSGYPFAAKAYALGKFAFVSDVCRLYALYEEGGIYLDTDMMVIKTLDDLLSFDFFIGEQKKQSLNAAIIGAAPKHPVIKGLLEGYKTVEFDYFDPLDIPKYLNASLDREHIKVFPKEYFYPLPYAKRGNHFKYFIKPETYTVHLWNHTWKQERDYLHDKNFTMALKKYFQRLIASPKSVGKDSFPLDFMKYFLADKFGSIYRMYKKQP